jgi:UDP-glucose 4-epimerase
MTTRSLLNAAVKCGVSCFIFSLAAAVFRERQGDLQPAASA